MNYLNEEILIPFPGESLCRDGKEIGVYQKGYELGYTECALDVMWFTDWASDKSYHRCTNGEWIQIGMSDKNGKYKTIAKDTSELYNLYKGEKK
jgi:hypothetical protein